VMLCSSITRIIDFYAKPPSVYSVRASLRVLANHKLTITYHVKVDPTTPSLRYPTTQTTRSIPQTSACQPSTLSRNHSVRCDSSFARLRNRARLSGTFKPYHLLPSAPTTRSQLEELEFASDPRTLQKHYRAGQTYGLTHTRADIDHFSPDRILP
jgi:hypothetical protein